LLSVVSPPTWLITAPIRNHNVVCSAGAGRKRPNVNLICAGFVRLIGDPTHIRRELGLRLIALRIGKDPRFAFARHREHPEVGAASAIPRAIKQVSPIAGPIIWHFSELVGGETPAQGRLEKGFLLSTNNRLLI